MRIMNADFSFESEVDGEKILKSIELAARNCYKSEDKGDSFEKTKAFVQRLLDSKHESVIEHESVTVRIICDRGVSHEIVRHRIGASFSQESTRYVNYGKKKHGCGIGVISPMDHMTDEQFDTWYEAMVVANKLYLTLLEQGASPEIARSVLPTSTKTEIVMTMNLRAWRHFFQLRTSPKAHPQMRELAIPMLEAFQQRIPVIFDDI